LVPLLGREQAFVRVLSVPVSGRVRGGFMAQCIRRSERRFTMNRSPYHQVLECASPLALSALVRGRKSGRGLPQSKTLARRRRSCSGSWSECMRQSERRLCLSLLERLRVRANEALLIFWRWLIPGTVELHASFGGAGGFPGKQ